MHFSDVRAITSDTSESNKVHNMKIQEFCLNILSFPWLAKLAEWKFHCSQFYRVST